MVDDDRKLLHGWHYPIYADINDQKIVDVLVQEGVPRELIRKYSGCDIENFEFAAFLEYPAQQEIKIVMITNVDKPPVRPPSTVGSIGMCHREIMRIPFTKEEWLRRLRL